MTDLFYTTFNSPYNNYTIVWKETGKLIKIQRIFLSDLKIKSEIKAFKIFKGLKIGSSSIIADLNEEIQEFFKGKNVQFQLDLLDFSVCPEFQKRVLLAEYNVPRGFVSTYKRISNYLGVVNGARAVGNALANNPFPIIIPCHRAIKSNGDLGGFQGGINTKKSLLQLEGVEFSPIGKVVMSNIFY